MKSLRFPLASRHSILAGLLVASLGLTSAFAGIPAWSDATVQPPAQSIHITLLQVNDVYALAPDKPTQNGGFARLATLRKKIHAENPNTLFILAGDTLSPSPGAQLFHGQQMVDLWNQVGLDLATLGNHEFDFGNEILLQRLKESRFQWVISNVTDRNTGKPFGSLAPYVIKDINGVKVGFFGLLTPDTRNASSAGPNVEFKDPTLTACETVSKMRREGAEVIVAITHLTMEEDKKVMRNMHHHVALVMGGHEHTLLQSVVGGTPIYKVGSDARTVGRYDLWVDPQTHVLQSMDTQMIPVDQSIPGDPAVETSVNAYLQKINAGLEEVLGSSTVALNAVQLDNRTRETNLGNYFADVYRETLQTDVALLNSGSIRSNQMYPAGPITRKQITSMLQFAGPVLKVSLSGKVLKAALENGVSRAGQEEGRFPQVSGLKFSFDPMKPVGNRVLSVSVKGQPLVESKQYTLAVPAYLVQKGGDDYTMLKTVQVLNDPQEAPTDAQMVQDAIQKAKSISPVVEGRIQAVGSKPITNKI